MAEVKWTDQALRDIENIAKFIAEDSEYYASIQTKRFFAAAIILESFPKTGRIVPEINLANIRELIVGNYRIIYTIVSHEVIDILTVHHSAKLFRKGNLRKRKN
jgi:toxin ParE1/3/4